MRHRVNALLGIVVAGAAFVGAMAQDAPSGDPARGSERYHAYGCWQCHGTTGAGGGWQGPKIAPDPLPFAAFAHQLRSPRAAMPQYPENLLHEVDVADIYAYLRSIPQGPSAEEITILR